MVNLLTTEMQAWKADPFWAAIDPCVGMVGEPAMDEVLHDEGIRRVMARDGVDDAQVLALAGKVRQRRS